MGGPDPTQLRPLSARSVVLSLLLGARLAEMSAGELVDAGAHFAIAETTLRAALSRSVTAGDLVRSPGGYALTERLRARQRRQDTALDARTVAWDGAWEVCVVTASGRSAVDRAELRASLGALRLAELREGVWLRPANLARPLPTWRGDLITIVRGAPEGDPAALAARLWDLGGWAEAGHRLLAALTEAESPMRRLTVGAAIVRHLSVDPVPPDTLLAQPWPAAHLRAAYAGYRAELGQRWGAAR